MDATTIGRDEVEVGVVERVLGVERVQREVLHGGVGSGTAGGSLLLHLVVLLQLIHMINHAFLTLSGAGIATGVGIAAIVDDVGDGRMRPHGRVQQREQLLCFIRTPLRGSGCKTHTAASVDHRVGGGRVTGSSVARMVIEGEAVRTRRRKGEPFQHCLL